MFELVRFPNHKISIGALIAGGLVATAGSGPAVAATIVVGSSGAPDAPTISAGVAMATDGDSVLVQTGTYLEIVQTGKSLAIIASDGPGTVTMNALNFGPALSFVNVAGSVVVEGLVLENGGGPRGGGLFLDGVTGGVTVRDCEFYGNLTSLTGGALDAYDTVVTVEGCVFEDNATSGASEQRGGAINLRGFNDGSSIENCSFARNGADFGGAVYWKGSCDFVGSTFSDNSAEKGGALYGSSLTTSQVRSCDFDSNTSSDNGGAIYAAGADLDVRFCLFEDCSSGALGGAIYLGGGSNTAIRWNFFDTCSASKGGGIAVAGMLTDVYRNTFYACTASSAGSALYFQQTNADISQNIFAESTVSPAVSCEFTANPTFTCTLVWNNAGGDFAGCADPIGDNGNFDADPVFCDDANDDFRISSTSPAAAGTEPAECDGEGIGAGGIGCGATATVTSSWGGIKSRFQR